MTLIRRILMKNSAEVVYPGFARMLKQIKFNERLPFAERIKTQETALKQLVMHGFNNVPYYQELSKKLDIKPQDIKTIQDLSYLPILTREDVKENINGFIYKNDKKHKNSRTGGTTGKPLQFTISNDSNYRGTALLYNGWSRAGYQLGDKLLLFAGGSIVSKPDMRSKIANLTRNYHSETSFNITDEKLEIICKYIISKKPLYIRGYASAITILADYFLANGYKNHSIKAVFTTAEPLLMSQRDIISTAFQAPVFDNYGLQDGGVSAYECDEHNGMHIDTFRSIMEICDENGCPVPFGTEGRIIATDLYNYAFPFIRYDTGDLAVADNTPCPCGNTSPRLIKITGRSADVLNFNTHKISGSGITVLMGKTSVDYYKVVQKNSRKVEIHLLFSDNNNDNIEQGTSLIKQFFALNAPEAVLEFFIYNNIQEFPHPKNKHKFIINKFC